MLPDERLPDEGPADDGPADEGLAADGLAAEAPAAAAKRGQRADARRNRARVLQVAAEVFAAEGLSVPVHEIARRAGVGTGTVSRHFPAKKDLLAAILLDRIGQLTARADELASTCAPGPAFFTFFATLIRDAAAHRALAEALAGAGYDVEAYAASAGHDLPGRLAAMLGRAQQAGAIRADVTYADIKSLMAGCLARSADGADGPGLDRVISVVCAGLSR
jgi:AcrR family transcriptional regulator